MSKARKAKPTVLIKHMESKQEKIKGGKGQLIISNRGGKHEKIYHIQVMSRSQSQEMVEADPMFGGEYVTELSEF